MAKKAVLRRSINSLHHKTQPISEYPLATPTTIKYNTPNRVPRSVQENAHLSFRPFYLGDALLLQRLRNVSSPLQIERTLLESISPVRTAIRSCFPWYRHSSFTYVLRQEENGLAREGLIQLRIRPHSHEADVTLLSPALDAPQGHPAIWQKLLTYSAKSIFRQNVCRLFSDLPDQPLLVNTFRQSGFVPLTQVTVWRLDSAPLAPSNSNVRPQQTADAPDLEKLYQRITPMPVQQLEMAPNQPDEDRIPPILTNPHHVPMSRYVLDDDRGPGLAGSLQILWGKRSAWIRLWVDTNNPDPQDARQLLDFALQRIHEAPHVHRAYIGVRAYQTGLNAHLSDCGFAPFTDRMVMVRNILQWQRRTVDHRMPKLEAVREAVPGSLAIPKFERRRLHLPDLGGVQTERRRHHQSDSRQKPAAWRQSNTHGLRYAEACAYRRHRPTSTRPAADQRTRGSH